jgi:lantibiotic biosynthesis protein
MTSGTTVHQAESPDCHGLASEWRALVGDVEARRFITIASRIADDASAAIDRRCVLALLLDVYLARTLKSDVHANRAITAIEGLTEYAATLTSTALHGGLAGVGFVISHATNKLSDWLESDSLDRCDDIDSVLIHSLRHKPSDCGHDLISGLAGIGTYAVERLPRPTARELLTLVIDLLSRGAYRVRSGIAWPTRIEGLPAEHQRRRSSSFGYECGVAHGISSLIVLLARSVAAGVWPERACYLLDGAITAILAQQAARAEQHGGPPTGGAWCEGRLGVAVSLLHAARLINRHSWESVALEMARGEVLSLDITKDTIDPSLCHGTAGTAHLFNRLYQATGERAFGDAARLWLARTAQQFDGEPVRAVADTSLLTGVSGAALALLAAGTGDVPAWDRILLADVPPTSARQQDREGTIAPIVGESFEVILRKVWEDILAIGDIDVDGDLFAVYGATSWHAVNALAALTERFTIDLVPEELLQLSTVRQQAQLLRSVEAMAARTPLRLNSSGSGRPLLLFPAGGGSVFVYRLLAKRITGRPVVAMQDPRLLATETPYLALEELVDRWIPDIQKTQSTGAYLLGGYCMGGALALDFASRLPRADQQASLVIMIDTTVPPRRACLSTAVADLRMRLAVRYGLFRRRVRQARRYAGARALLLAQFASDVKELLRAVQWALPEVIPSEGRDLPAVNEDVLQHIITTYLRDFEPYSTLPGLSLEQVLARMHVTRHNATAFSRYVPRRRFHGRVIMFQIRGSERVGYWQRFVDQPIAAYDCDIATGGRDPLRRAHAEMIFTDENVNTFSGALLNEITAWEQRQLTL